MGLRQLVAILKTFYQKTKPKKEPKLLIKALYPCFRNRVTGSG